MKGKWGKRGESTGLVNVQRRDRFKVIGIDVSFRRTYFNILVPLPGNSSQISFHFLRTPTFKKCA